MKGISTPYLPVLTCAAFLLPLFSTGCNKSSSPAVETRKIDYVNPRIGSGGHGHVFVGANVPYGMVQLGPTGQIQAWDFTSGYHDSDSTIIGFSHTHLSGTGVGDLFDITFMPVTGEVTYARGNHDDPLSGLWSYGERSKEIVRPGYYSVPLTRNGVLAELTATERTGYHRYTFPESDTIAIVIDLANGGCWDRPGETKIEQTGPNTVSGYRYSTGWADNQKVFFSAEFSEPITGLTLHGDNNMYGRVEFAPSDSTKVITARVGISPNSIAAAEKNMHSETDGLSFEDVVAKAENAWERELSRIEVKSDNKADLEQFYTAMYHTMFHPSLFSDYGEQPQYTIYSLWDTYRAEMPLISITDPQRYGEMVNCMLDIHDTQGRLPVWHLWGCETDCMVGNPGVIIVADAVTKNAPGVDVERALKAMMETADDTIRGYGFRKQYGFIPADLMPEAIAWDMEYAIADAAISNAAAHLGKQEIAADYLKRSKSYKNYFDPATGFMRGKFSNGEWRTPFNPSFSSRQNDYCEGNAWQYTWLVPQDIEGLSTLFGGKEKMLTALDSLFTASPEMVGDDITPDISGMIGQYVHGNEPSHHIAYIYSMMGEREKTAQLVDKIFEEQYSNRPDGLAGNEDCGQMSAWLIFSGLGFYPVEPAGGRYWIGRPRYPEATVKLENGKTFTVKKGEDNSTGIILNGKKLDRNYITHEEIINGGNLIIN